MCSLNGRTGGCHVINAQAATMLTGWLTFVLHAMQLNGKNVASIELQIKDVSLSDEPSALQACPILWMIN